MTTIVLVVLTVMVVFWAASASVKEGESAASLKS